MTITILWYLAISWVGWGAPVFSLLASLGVCRVFWSQWLWLVSNVLLPCTPLSAFSFCMVNYTPLTFDVAILPGSLVRASVVIQGFKRNEVKQWSKLRSPRVSPLPQSSDQINHRFKSRGCKCLLLKEPGYHL